MTPIILLFLIHALVQIGQAELISPLNIFRKRGSNSLSKEAQAQGPVVAVPDSSANKNIISVKEFRKNLDSIINAARTLQNEQAQAQGQGQEQQVSKNAFQPIPEEWVTKCCSEPIEIVFGRTEQDPEFKEKVLSVLGRAIGKDKAKLNEALVFIAKILVKTHQVESQAILTHLNQRLFAGFRRFGLMSPSQSEDYTEITDQDYTEMSEEAIRLVGGNGKQLRKLAESDVMKRALRTMGFSACPNEESFMNLAALLLTYSSPNLRRPDRSYSKKVWTAVFATLLKFASESGTSEPALGEVFLLFYRQGRFAETYDKMFQKVNINHLH